MQSWTITLYGSFTNNTMTLSFTRLPRFIYANSSIYERASVDPRAYTATYVQVAHDDIGWC